MTSLEFINQNIFECENHIKHLEDKILEHKNYPSFVKSHEKCIEELKPILKQLQQIKAELEAWEVVKQYCDYQDGDRFNCIPQGFYLIEPIKGKDFLIVRKALEEKHE